MIGRRYFLPRGVDAALEQVFADGYWANRYEREAREFTSAALKPYLRCLGTRPSQ